MSTKADIFTQHRPKLFGVAYRMLGIKADAEDVLQDAYLRWHDTDASDIKSAEAWLTTTTTRLAIARLRHAKVERANYFGPWLPEPLSQADLNTPELAAEFDSDVSIAFMAVLEALAPEERAAFILHDIVDDDYADIAGALGKSEAACRQMVHRARERLTSRRRRFVVDDATRTRMLQRFIQAVNTGDRDQLKAVFAEDAVMTSDGGGKALAAIRPLQGAERIAMLWYAVNRRLIDTYQFQILPVNGEPGLAFFVDGRLVAITSIETDGDKIQQYFTVRNPDKLAAFAESLRGGV